MRYIKYSLFLVSTMLISGCAELSAINDKVGDWAGQMNQTLYGSKDGSVEQHNGRQVYTKTRNGKYVYQDSGTLQLKRNIDDVFLKVRWEFGFRPTNADSDSRKVYHTVQGTFYHVSGYFESDVDTDGVHLGENYLEVIIEKGSKNQVNVEWKATGSARWLDSAKQRLLNTLK